MSDPKFPPLPTLGISLPGTATGDLRNALKDLQARVEKLEREQISGVSTSPMAGSATSAGGPTKPARRSGEGTAVLGEGEEDYPKPASPSRPGQEPSRPQRINGDGGERPAPYDSRILTALEHHGGLFKAVQKLLADVRRETIEECGTWLRVAVKDVDPNDLADHMEMEVKP